MTNHRDNAQLFRALHTGDHPLALPNAWDVPSAKLIEAAGAAAIATTSAGVAWALGAADGEQVDKQQALAAVARIAAAVDIPVTADVEAGFGKDPQAVAETIRQVIAAGVVGVNIEDSVQGRPEPLRPVAEQSARIAAARAAADDEGTRLFINARIDTYLSAAGGPAETLSRAATYLEAGADGIFVPGVVDPVTTKELAEGVDAPLNVMAGAGAPPVAELATLGVARISLGSGIAQAAHELVRRAAHELLTDGTYETLSGAADYAELNALLGSRP